MEVFSVNLIGGILINVIAGKPIVDAGLNPYKSADARNPGTGIAVVGGHRQTRQCHSAGVANSVKSLPPQAVAEGQTLRCWQHRQTQPRG